MYYDVASSTVGTTCVIEDALPTSVFAITREDLSEQSMMIQTRSEGALSSLMTRTPKVVSLSSCRSASRSCEWIATSQACDEYPAARMASLKASHAELDMLDALMAQEVCD